MENTSTAIRTYALEQVGGPYVFGATAATCTPSLRRQRIGQYPEYTNHITRNCPVLSGRAESCDGCDHEGKLAHDCAQLTRHAAKAAGLTLPSGATSQWNKGDWQSQGSIDTLPRDCVAFLYRRKSGSTKTMSHTGVYMGDGTVADARGHDDGVLHKPLEDFPWTHWGILRGMDCPEGITVQEDEPADSSSATQKVYKLGERTLSKGCEGEDVRELQEALNRLSCTVTKLTVDGSFGTNTARAVYTFQTIYEIKADSKYGPESHKTLMAALAGGSEGDKTWEQLTLAEKVEDLHRWRLEMMGGGAADG